MRTNQRFSAMNDDHPIIYNMNERESSAAQDNTINVKRS